MNERLKIECEWWGPSNDGSDISEICRGAIGISVGEDCLTRLEDTWGNTIRKRMHGGADTLARWFAGNWWRLRWEPETPESREDVDWRMSHSMSSAGDGFCWPSILFASDGDSIAVACRPSSGRDAGPVRYLSDVNTRITARDFEREIDAFLTLVLSRLHSEGHGKSELAELWAEVMKERADPILSNWRRIEAICGYDPDEAPEDMIRLVMEDGFQLGRQAVVEVAAHARHETAEVLRSIHGFTLKKGGPLVGGFRCRPVSLKTKPRYQKGIRPWEKAAKLAQTARQEFGLGRGPVSNMHLADALRTNKKAFADHSNKAATPMSMALHRGGSDKADIYIGSSWGTSRRFAASRILGDWLDKEGETELLIPAGEAKTTHQQFQRAFAQEFLCPFDSLRDRLQTEYPTAEKIEDAAEYFGVSPLVVKTALVNKGNLDRDVLSRVA